MIECESAVRANIRRRCKFGFPPFCVSEAQNCLISAIFWPFQSKRSSKILADQCASRDHKVAEIQRHLLGASDIIAALPLVAINHPTERRRRKFQQTHNKVDWNGGDERPDATFLHSTPLAVIWPATVAMATNFISSFCRRIVLWQDL